MRVHVLQHVPFEGLGSITAWLEQRGATTSWTRFYESQQLPDLSEVDFVIALGGPMSINDETELPWLVEEKRFIAEAIFSGKAVLGICLGAQLIANALGARVYPNSHKEIGWFDIARTSDRKECFQFPEATTVFHWHGETFDLPRGAIKLASSVACENQAFQIGANVIGLQFHLETTPESAALLFSHCGNEVVAAPYIQTEAEMRAASDASYARINSLMGEVLEYVNRSYS